MWSNLGRIIYVSELVEHNCLLVKVYVTRYEDGIMIAKNQDDESIYFVGKFGIGEVVLFSHASANVEKITRLKTLMSLYNVIAPKAKQIEKKK